jgi:hypothetical protein
MLAGKPRPAAPFHFLSQRAHRILGDFGAFAAIDRGLGNIDSGKDFAAAAFALNPKLHRGLHGIFRALKAAARDGLSDEILLFGREVYLHALNGGMLCVVVQSTYRLVNQLEGWLDP